MILLTETLILPSLITLAVIGLVASVVLYFVAQKFKVFEDPRIEQIEGVLPGANCGGCGYPGCHGFADACVKADTLEGKLCPVGGQAVMAQIATIMGQEISAAEPKIAVVRCNGTCANRPQTTIYDGAKSCRVLTQLYSGQTACSYGCLGLGDCVDACQFGAIKLNPETGIVEVNEEACTGCGACVKACPKNIIELRNKGKKGMRVYVSCVNKDKGAAARKACSAACIGCGKCAKVCPFDAIVVENNVAYIDFTKCKSCRKCVAECPTGAIHDVNFPKPVDKTPKPAAPKAEAVKPAEKPAEKPAPAEEPAQQKDEQIKIEIITNEPVKEVVKEPVKEVAKEEAPKADTPQELVKEEVKEDVKPVEEVPAKEPQQEVQPPVNPADEIDPALRVTPRSAEARQKKAEQKDDQPTLF